MPPESHSTAQAEQLDNLCDAILQRLRLLRRAESIVDLSHALGDTAAATSAACDHLLRAGLVSVCTIAQKDGDAPVWHARGYYLPEALESGPLTDTHGPIAGTLADMSPDAGTTLAAPRRSFGIHNNPGLLTDIAEAAAVNLCVRQDLERQGASADVLAALTAAATALSGLLLADLRKRQVLA